MTELVAMAVIVAVALAFADLRKGVYLALAVGFLQDPIRKLLPGEPVQMTAVVAVLCFAAVMGTYLRGRTPNFNAIPGWRRVVATPLRVFVVVVLIQSVLAIVNTGSLLVGGIGLLAYLLPAVVVVLSGVLCRSTRDVVRLLWTYVVLCLIMASGLYLARFGIESDILRTVGVDLFVYPQSGGQVALPAGFFRAPEIAAWHVGMAICVLTVLAVSARGGGSGRLAVILIPVFVGGLLFAGRRKYAYEIFLFVLIYGSMLIYFQRGAAKLVLGGLVSGAIALGALSLGFFGDDPLDTLVRPAGGSEGFGEMAVVRFLDNSIESFGYVVDYNGILGSGAGTGSQGAQYFGGGITGGAAEGGFGKVLGELGIPGLLSVLWLMFSLVRLVWGLLLRNASEDVHIVRLACGLFAILAASGFVFVTAHQAYGDPFVLMLTGLLLGSLIFVLGHRTGGSRQGRNPAGPGADWLSAPGVER